MAEADTTLTARQQEVLAFIRKHYREQGCAPTIREIAVGMGIKSPNAVAGHLRPLSRKGYIRRDNAGHIRLPLNDRSCPCCGRAMETAQ